MKTPLPSFLVVGAAKAGTTSIFQILSQHPEVFLPSIKECRFFSGIRGRHINPFTREKQVECIEDMKSYSDLFAVNHSKVAGDISPDYLFYYKESIKNIKKYLCPDVRIIISLRDPVERAYSNYMHLRREGLTALGFYEYMQVEDGFDRETTWYGFLVKESGLYSAGVKAYMEAFDNVKVIFFEDFIADVQSSMQMLYGFLNLSSYQAYTKPDFTNKTGEPKSVLLDKLLSRNWQGKQKIFKLLKNIYPELSLQRLREANLVKPGMDPQAKRYLQNYYRNEVRQLNAMLSDQVPWQWCLSN